MLLFKTYAKTKGKKHCAFFIKIDRKVAHVMKILVAFKKNAKEWQKNITIFIKTDRKVARLIEILVVV